MKRSSKYVVVAVLALTASLLTACSAPTPNVREHRVEWLAFESKSMFQFVEWSHGYQYTGEYWWMDWTSDGCSAGSPDTGWYFDFSWPCRHHDFGYRNFKKLERDTGINSWNATNKHNLDQQFLGEMQADCDGRWFLARGYCFNQAYFYYLGVTNYGGSPGSSDPDSDKRLGDF